MKKFFFNNLFLFKRIREYSKSYLAVVILISLTAFAGPLTTVLIPKLITDALLNKEEIGELIQLIFIAVSANIIRIVAKTIFNEVYVPYNQNKIQCGINALLMEKSKKLDLECYDDPEFYNKYTRALGQADSGMISFIDNFSAVMDRLFYITTVIAIVSTLDPVLVIFGVVCVFTLFFFYKKSSQYRYDTSVLITNDTRCANYSKRIHYLPEYAKEIRTSNISKILVDNYIAAKKNVQNTIRKRSRRISSITLADEGIRIFMLQFVTMLYLVFRIRQGRLDASSFVALFLATMQISMELFNFVNCINEFYKLSLYTDDLIYILNYKSNIELPDNPGAGTVKIETIKLLATNKVGFSYDGKKSVLHNIDFKVSKGEHIALVGYNGAGKTSLVKLLLRLYDPNSGEVLLNGENLKQIDINSYRNKFGIVFQDHLFYALTVAENVLMKRVVTNQERQRVVEALKKSQLYDDVASFPNGIDTILTKEFDENGVVLSGGQAQKLSLARIFAQSDKEIFILDEASGAMDPISESKVNKSILEFCKDKILILISHRLSICKDMSKIYVIDNGEIIESGSHSELMRQGGLYSKMYSIQLENYKLSGDYNYEK